MDKTELRKHAEAISMDAIACIQAVLTKHNMGLIEAAREHGEAERLKALNEVLTELVAMYDKADQATSMHKGMRMAISSVSGRVEALIQNSMRIDAAHRCIAPVCGPDCSDCSGALLPATIFRYAKRYAYLRGRPLDSIKKGGVFAGATPDNVVLNGDDLDAAIDAALALQPNTRVTGAA